LQQLSSVLVPDFITTVDAFVSGHVRTPKVTVRTLVVVNALKGSLTAYKDGSAENYNDDNAPSNEALSTHIVFPGGGIFFYYQAGLVTFLRENNYDLASCSFSGASAGALTATLTATDVDFYKATDLALSMAADAGVWDRRSGLQGIWGPMIEEWLNTLLPASIDSIEGRLTLLVTPVPSFGKLKVSNFLDRNELIQCNMASVHLVRISIKDEVRIPCHYLTSQSIFLVYIL
jgi:hypothetical protein